VSLYELAIRRHVLAYMLSMVFVLFGLISFQRIGVDRHPEAEFPMITVATRFFGADPGIIDAALTGPIEKAVNSISGIEHVDSTSAPDISVVRVRFELEKNLDVAFNEVQAKLSQVLPLLPEEAEAPVVQKVEIGGQPVIWLTLSGDRTLQQLNVYANNVIKRRLETIAGVGEVRIGGERRRTIRIEADPERMAAFGITVQDLQAAFRREHMRLPGGFLVDGLREDLLDADLEFHDLDSLAAMIVRDVDGAAVRLRDVARVEDGLADFRLLARFDGEPTVGIGIVKVRGANAVAVVEAVEQRLAEDVVPNLPPGLELREAHNEGELIRNIAKSLEEHIVLGTVLTAVIVLVFLRNLRSTLIVAAAIPVSLMGAVAVIHFLGFTFNIMTLLGLLLLIGVVVDDAIVVLENVFRHREETGATVLEATLEGTREVVMAVLAATLTLVSIFAPVVFMQGMAARMFQSFAVVVTAGVLVSLLVSLTLTPMLCARHLRVREQQGPVARRFERMFEVLDGWYRRALELALHHRSAVVIATLAAVLSSGWLFGQIGKGFFPVQDDGYFIVTVKLPLGVSIAETAARLELVEAVLDRQPEIAGHFSTVGQSDTAQVSQATTIVHLQPWNERRASQQEVIERLSREFADVAGVEAFPAPPSPIGGMRGEPLHFVLTGPDLEGVGREATSLFRRLSTDPEMGRIDLDLQLDLPQLRMHVDRDQLARAGLGAQDVALAIGILAGGRDIGYYNDEPGDGERYRIRLKAGEGTLTRAEDIAKLYLRTPGGELLRMDSVVRLERVIGPAVISRYDLQYAANFRTAPLIDEGSAGQRALAVARDTLPPGYTVELAGRAEEFSKTAGYMAITFVTALVLVYMVLASQFNSFLQPLMIMIAQPLAIIGGVFALWAFGHTLNIFSMIGLTLLVGLVAKNSILLIDLTNQLRARGVGVDAALAQACPVRMRPVLMTSLTIVLAMLPAAAGLGAGSDTNGPLAVAVIGGMVSSTLLTLVVVPAVYSLVENARERRALRREAARRAVAG
jgi:HAE1 family hydrophobic/amphiphilic exporter-1